MIRFVKLFTLVFILAIKSVDPTSIWPFSNTDPEIKENITEIIRRNGFLVEQHNVTTDDGYILCLIRIMNEHSLKRSKVVFLQHGLLDSAHTWVNNLRNQSLGFILAGKGYDVWLGNSRGNIYSRGHVNLTTKDKQFWRFSYDEMADFDLPACIKYVINVTGSDKLAYVGHSQGTQIGFARFSTDQSLSSQISVFIALAPVAFVAHLQSPIKYLAKFAERSKDFIDHLISGEFQLNLGISKWVLCHLINPKYVCNNALFLFAGFDVHNLNQSRIPVYLAHTPAGTSFQNIIHHAQGYTSKQFKRYDHGTDENMKVYGQPTPPEYKLNGLNVPVAVFSGGNDWLADPEDLVTLMKQIEPTVIFKMHLPTYNHLDFVWGMNAQEKVYPSVLELLDRYTH